MSAPTRTRTRVMIGAMTDTELSAAVVEELADMAPNAFREWVQRRPSRPMSAQEIWMAGYKAGCRNGTSVGLDVAKTVLEEFGRERQQDQNPHPPERAAARDQGSAADPGAPAPGS